MRRYPVRQTRAEYARIQVERAAAKWTLNGVTREEVEWFAARLRRQPIPDGPVLCLGVRNGLEVDLFRDVLGREVQGVELCAHGRRKDVWVGSFDAMPPDWAGRFGVLYSNALDHAYDPGETACEWRRVSQPGAVLALSLDPDTEPTASDPIAGITVADLIDWFGGSALALSPMRLTRPRRVLWRLP